MIHGYAPGVLSDRATVTLLTYQLKGFIGVGTEISGGSFSLWRNW